MDIIDLPSTFGDKSVQSAVPNYFKYSILLLVSGWPYQIISSIVKYQSFVINIINLLEELYLISIKFFLILISKFVP